MTDTRTLHWTREPHTAACGQRLDTKRHIGNTRQGIIAAAEQYGAPLACPTCTSLAAEHSAAR